MPISWLYEKIADVRNALYERGVFRIHDLGARTISIGNISMGGTGKTPLVAHVAEILADAGEKVCILTRGYGRESSGRVLVSDGERVLVDARTGGDEPVELARKLIGKAIVVADADRVAAAKWALGKFAVSVFILDDGFQHRRAKRDLDIVCVDAMTSLASVLLREPIANLRRANAVVITRADLVDSIAEIKQEIQRRNSAAAIFASRTEIVGVTSLAEFFGASETKTSAAWSKLRDDGNHDGDNEVRVLAFCALGNPEAFFTQLLKAFDAEPMNDEFDLSVVKQFRDHHVYSQQDIDDLERQARETDVHAFVTTAKDAVKLETVRFSFPCYVVEIETRVDDAETFRNLVTSS